MDNFFFTVFTPSYNRCHTLTRVYESLNKQTFKGFEWLIIDDGSDDGTEELVEDFKKTANFHIVYKWVSNRGKQKVKNIAIHEAQGMFFFTLDSDDWIEPFTLERFRYHWESIPLDRRKIFSGVAGLTRFAGKGIWGKGGELNGIKNPKEIIDTDMISIRTKYKVNGEKCGTHLTSIMKKFPAPEFEGEKFSSEAIVWRRIAKQKYLVRYVNEIYRNQEIQEGGLSDPIAVKKRLKNSPKGMALRYNEEVEIMPSILQKLKSSINYVRCCLHANYSLLKIIKDAIVKPILFYSLPGGLLMYFRDKLTI